MALFGRTRDVNLIKTINRELLGDVITQQASFYKVRLEETTFNLYGEAAGGKFYDGPVIFNCLVGAFSGLFYSFRLINYTFCDFKKGNKSLYLTLNKINYNSSFYTNSSLAGTFSIFFLFIFSYLITYFLVKYFISGNYLFSDYMNTTILSNYYSIISSYNGYLLNFSFVNLTVTSIALAFFFSKYRKVQRIHNIFKCLFTVIVWVLFLFIFYNFL